MFYAFAYKKKIKLDKTTHVIGDIKRKKEKLIFLERIFFRSD